MDVVTIYYIIGSLVGCITIFSTFFYLLSSKLKIQWEQAINLAITENNKTLKEEIGKDISVKIGFIKKDIDQIKDDLDEVKGLIKAQSETLLAIQLSLVEVNPKVSNLERRVDTLENRNS